MEGQIELCWRKASYSGNGGSDCVEVATSCPSGIAVRDSKNPDGPVLTLDPTGWRYFVTDVKAGQHDLA